MVSGMWTRAASTSKQEAPSPASPSVSLHHIALLVKLILFSFCNSKDKSFVSITKSFTTKQVVSEFTGQGCEVLSNFFRLVADRCFMKSKVSTSG